MHWPANLQANDKRSKRLILLKWKIAVFIGFHIVITKLDQVYNLYYNKLTGELKMRNIIQFPLSSVIIKTTHVDKKNWQAGEMCQMKCTERSYLPAVRGSVGKGSLSKSSTWSLATNDGISLLVLPDPFSIASKSSEKYCWTRLAGVADFAL